MPRISRRRFSTGLAAAVATTTTMPAAFAQAYPAKPIKLIAPYPPGGGVDTVARLIAERLATRLHRTCTRASRLTCGVILSRSSMSRSAQLAWW